MPEISVITILSEVLVLNKIVVSAAVVWGVALAVVYGNQWQKDKDWCEELRDIRIFGLVLGIIAPIGDTIFEVLEDIKAISDDEPLLYLPIKKEFTCSRECKVILLFSETLFRLAGNMLLFWLYVTASTYEWFNTKDNNGQLICDDCAWFCEKDEIYDFLFLSLVISFIRIGYAWTYPSNEDN
jgi:hypothetical protein